MIDKIVIRKKIEKNLDIFLAHDIFKNCIVMCPDRIKLQVGSCIADYINHHYKDTKFWKIKQSPFHTDDGVLWNADDIRKVVNKQDEEFMQTMNVIIFDEFEEVD